MLLCVLLFEALDEFHAPLYDVDRHLQSLGHHFPSRQAGTSSQAATGGERHTGCGSLRENISQEDASAKSSRRVFPSTDTLSWRQASSPDRLASLPSHASPQYSCCHSTRSTTFCFATSLVLHSKQFTGIFCSGQYWIQQRSSKIKFCYFMVMTLHPDFVNFISTRKIKNNEKLSSKP